MPTGWTLKYNYPNTGEVTLEYFLELAPVIQCPSNITVNNDGSMCDVIVTFAATETTAIPASTITDSIDPGSNFNVGTATVNATATSSSGTDSCTFNVTVNATAGPAVSFTAPTGQDVNSSVLNGLGGATPSGSVYSGLMLQMVEMDLLIALTQE